MIEFFIVIAPVGNDVHNHLLGDYKADKDAPMQSQIEFVFKHATAGFVPTQNVWSNIW